MDPATTMEYEEALQVSLRDSLTGLYSHGYFQLCLDREIRLAQRYGTPLTLGLIDIDWFSRFNKRSGYLEGDQRLRQVAAVIAASIRETDVAARFLGDVCAVLLTRSEMEQGRSAAERIRAAVERETGGTLTVSIGLAAYSRDATAATLLGQAQEALRQAKATGKNRVHSFRKDEPWKDETKPRVLVVDDEALNLKLFDTLLRGLDYDVVKATSGEEALHAVHKTEIDLILLDLMMPGMNGYEVCRRLKADETTRMIPIIMLTAVSGAEAKIKGIEAGVDDFLTKPPNKTELLARTQSLIRVKGLNDNLTNTESVLLALANAIEARDPYTEGHVQRVAQLALALGQRMNLPAKDMKALKLGGVLHDIGKIKVPDAILNKPGPLTPQEREIMETHAIAGYQMCLPLHRALGAALDVVRSHHEKLDGSGYPDGLKGEEIPIPARIMAVVDIYDALVTDRPYRKGMAKADSLRIIHEMVAGGKLDRDVVRQFAKLVDPGAASQGSKDDGNLAV